MKEEKTLKVLIITFVVLGIIWAGLLAGYAIQMKSIRIDTLVFHSYSLDSTSVKLIVKGDTLLYFHSKKEPRGYYGDIYHVIYNPRKK